MRTKRNISHSDSTRDFNLRILLQQRSQIQKLIGNQNSFLWKIVITLLSGNVLITILYKLVDDGIITNAWFYSVTTMTVLSYLIIQILLVLLFVVMGVLFGSNNNRLYICAIDDYVFREYGISTLFQDGEVTKVAVTGFKELFPQSMIALGISIAITFAYMLFGTSLFKSLLRNDLIFLILLAFEILIALLLIFKNFVLKARKMRNIQSNLEKECLKFFYRTR